MKKTKKIIALGLIAVMAVSVFTGCSKKTSSESDFDKAKEIGVITREDGSGTRGVFCRVVGSGCRGAFIELFGVEVYDSSGEYVE